ncbi:CLUMA_CG020619, isoform A [Clunio marinus]|uniref:CLUMA_CG020619, isoform A n=1 Tax=Clunio marinus TaxID=568069 RepID=A0A1J1J7A3_9DIPT|nr:CLUMA_CG020619, isoform A [Clunio marinus]
MNDDAKPTHIEKDFKESKTMFQQIEFLAFTFKLLEASHLIFQRLLHLSAHFLKIQQQICNH